MTLNKRLECEKAYQDYPSQDNEGFVPDRLGFKCGFNAAWHILHLRIDQLEAENKCLQFNLEQKSKEIGRSEHRDNTVDYIYDKLETYSRHLDEVSAERDRLKELLKECSSELHCVWSAYSGSNLYFKIQEALK